jgi:hypothetical protein
MTAYAVNEMTMQFNKFDRILLRTSANVKYVSSPDASPKGEWSVIVEMNDDVMACQGDVVIRIPKQDVMLSAKYSLTEAMQSLEKLRGGRKEEEAVQVNGPTRGRIQQKRHKHPDKIKRGRTD